jgi:hypothetical protein
MGNQVCSNGHRWKTRFQPASSELRCPEPGCGLPAEPTLKARSTALGGGAAEPKVLAEAHSRFSALVTEWPCFFADAVEGRPRRPDHNCWGPKDPHHLIPARFIKAHYGELPFKRTPIRLKQGDIEVEILVTKQGAE